MQAGTGRLGYGASALNSTLLRAVWDSMNDGLFIVNRSGRIEYANQTAARLFGLDRDQLMHKFIGDLVRGDPVILSVFRTGTGYKQLRCVVETVRRGRVQVEKTAEPVTDEKGRVVAAVEVLREIDSIELDDPTCDRRPFADIVWCSAVMGKTLDIAHSAARSEVPILIEGETGTGKELLARAIHRASPRGTGPLVPVNCSAIPRELAESEMFGYVTGAFTGAHRAGRVGKFEAASGGTLFLDEIGEMPLELQAKLLRVLDTGEVYRLGSPRPTPVDVRVISATNRDLSQMVREGRFRRDLFYRLSVVRIKIPPLRHRKEDIPALLEHFCRKYGIHVEFAPGATDLLLHYEWPGNIRELESFVRRLAVMYRGRTDVGADLAEEVLFLASELSHCGQNPEMSRHEPAFGAGTPPLNRAIPYADYAGHDHSPMPPLSEYERFAILRTLRACGGNVAQCARVLQIARSTVYAKMRAYGIDPHKPIDSASASIKHPTSR